MVFYAVLTLRLLLSYSEAYIVDVLVQGSSVLEEVLRSPHAAIILRYFCGVT